MSAIVDLEGLGLRQLYLPALRYASEMIQLAEDNYPESTGMICVINAPPIFQTFWSLVKPMIPPRTLKRIHFFGSDYKETLISLLPPENVPAYLGGLCTCRAKEGCVTWTKSEGYKNPNLDPKGFTVQKIPFNTFWILPMSVRQDDLDYYIYLHGSEEIVNCEFETKKGNIRFGVRYLPGFQQVFPQRFIERDSDFKEKGDFENSETLIEMGNVFSGQKIISKCLKIEKSGTYLFIFENILNSDVFLHYNLSSSTNEIGI